MVLSCALFYGCTGYGHGITAYGSAHLSAARFSRCADFKGGGSAAEGRIFINAGSGVAGNRAAGRDRVRRAVDQVRAGEY